MIYVFTDLEFGRHFLKSISRLRERHAAEITVVLSGKRGWPQALMARLKSRLRWSISKWRDARRLSSELGVQVMVVDDINARAMRQRIDPHDHGFVAGFNQIFKAGTIRRFQSLVNCHPSLLPYYRGPVPSYWCLLHGETATGYTFHRISEAIDQGEILCQEVVPIAEADTPAQLNARITAPAAAKFEAYLLSLLGERAFERSSVNAGAVYKHRVDYKSFPAQG